MKRTKMALLSLVAMVCLIGTAFAAWTWGDANSTGDTDTVGVSIAAATDYGTVTATYSGNGFVVDESLGTIEIEVAYTMQDDSLAPEDNMQLVVAVNAGGLSSYIDFTTTSSTEAGWLDATGIAYGDKAATVTITPSWTNTIDNASEYQTVKGIVDSLSNISITVTVEPVV